MKPSTVSNAASIFMLVVVGIVLLQVTTTYAAPHPASYPGFYSPMSMEGTNPEYLLQTFARLREALNADDLEKFDYEDPNVLNRMPKRGLYVPKRTPDVGVQRGYVSSVLNDRIRQKELLNTVG